MLSERINQKNETRKNEGRNDDLVSDEKGTSAISGKNSEIVNFYLYFCLNTLRQQHIYFDAVTKKD